MIGQTLAHYKILEKIGSGGMGDVYLAEDTKLDRKVALKVLPPELAENEDRRARFQREAKAIAALDHPNIVQVFSVEEAEGIHFITMQLVHGKTLTELLPKNGFPLNKFFDIAIPLADAVAAAHQEGITHRDLKPDNMMVGDDGRIKVLDFGLAKPTGGFVGADADSKLPTQAKTAAGVIVGTVNYMSPEQAQGKALDARSDIFSLGVVLYEMLTGRRPFGGETPAEVLSSIIKETAPPAKESRSEIPRELSRMVQRCLAKEPTRRLQSALDVRNELEDFKEALSTGELQASDMGLSARTSFFRVWIFAGSVVLVLTGGFLGALFWTHGRSTDSNVPRLTNPVQVTSAIGVENHPTWSPEGGRIAYMSDQSGNLDIWVSQVSGGPAANLTEDFTGRDSDPSWSPDGSQIAFRSFRDGGGGCFVMSALGGTPRRVVSLPNNGWARPAWSSDSSKLACTAWNEPNSWFIGIVTLASQEVERLPLQVQYEPRDLSWSPDGRYFAYVDAPEDGDITRLWIVSLSGESIPLTDGATEVRSPVWSRNGSALFYVSNRGGSKDLWMQELEEDAAPKGDPNPITTGLGIQSVSVLADGTRIAYSKGGRFSNVWRVRISPDRVATWFDAEQLTFDQAFVEFLDLSPDGQRLAVSSNRSGSIDLWTLPAEGGEMQPLTNDPALDWCPSWSPDGREIAFYSSRAGNRDIYVISSDGGAVRQLTTHPGGDTDPTWSPDGQQIAYTSIRDGNYDIWMMSATGADRKPLTQYALWDHLAAWSPDGRWIAFASDREAGDGVAHLWRVAADGGEPERLTERVGVVPRWAPDGETVYFRALPFEVNEYWTVSLEDRTERLVADLSGKPGRQGSWTLGTDGEYLYFTWEVRLGDIWVMDVVTDESE